MLKATAQRIIRETCQENGNLYNTLDRDTKWSMFCNVCDSLLEAGTISQIQHERWTSPF
jgi:hypothetical protein